eukprot:NODE_1976_length_496_cov_0.143577.p2 type:complete len:105 gc:universal NODE_1976_length_496_cov_0.143577:60-374(+)
MVPFNSLLAADKACMLFGSIFIIEPLNLFKLKSRNLKSVKLVKFGNGPCNLFPIIVKLCNVFGNNDEFKVPFKNELEKSIRTIRFPMHLIGWILSSQQLDSENK